MKKACELNFYANYEKCRFLGNLLKKNLYFMTEQKELAEKMKRKEKEEIIRFRKFVEDRVNRFAKDQRHFIEFQPLERLHRTIM